MNVPTDPGNWTPEQVAEIMLDVAVKASAGWADRAWLLLSTARDAAPPEERNAWIDATRDAFTRDLANLCGDLVVTTGATPDQAQRFAHEVAATMASRFAELTAGGTTQGGRA